MTLRILYGIQCTGNGHLARARCMVPALRKAGIEMRFLMSGGAENQFFSMDEFEGYEYRRGLTMTIVDGVVRPVRTLIDNNNLEFMRDVIRLDLSDVDLVISDFEPISAWAARLKGVPSIAISHQAAFRHDVPKVNGYLLSRLVMRYFAPCRTNLGVHWHHFNQPILPPIIEDHYATTIDPKLILVYMGFESLDEVIALLAPFPQYDFQVFAKVKQVVRQGNITINPLSHTAFHRNLERCAGVICNTGFELSSECLQLGKKLLTKPLKGQYEQLCNAVGLQSLSRATVMEEFDQEALRAWLDLGVHTPIQYPNVAEAIARWLVETPREDVDALVSGLWESFDHPFEYDPEFGNRIAPKLVF